MALTYDSSASAPTNVGAYTVIATAPEVQTVAKDGGNITFGWSAQAGLTYHVSYTANLTPPVV